MATTKLTDRQREIKGLLDKGNTPREVADQLGITENAVYQARRRISGGKGKRTATKRTATKRATSRSAASTRRTSGRKSARRSRSTTRASQPTPAPAAEAPARQLTPLQAIRQRKHEIEAALKDRRVAVQNAQYQLKKAEDALAEGESKVGEEIARLEAAEAALSGAKPKPKPARKRASGSKAARNGSGSKQAAQTAAQNTGPAAAADPAPDTAPAPASTPAPGPEAASATPPEQERPGAATLPEFADAETVDAEAVEPPTGDEAAALVGADTGEFEQGTADPFDE